MKHSILTSIFSLIFTFLALTVVGQEQTLVLQSETEGKDAIIVQSNGAFNQYGNTNNGNDSRILGWAWTNGGVPQEIRSLIEFNLVKIPENAVIKNAELTLFTDPNSISFNGTHRGSNAGYIQRIVSSWKELEVTWNTQPEYAEINKVSFSSLSGNQNLVANVTNLVKDMVSNGNHGFLFRLQTEDPYRALVFASSDVANVALHPKLEITYDLTVPGTAVVWKDLFQVTANGNTVTKTAENDSATGGAASKNTLKAGEDGWVQIKAVETDKTRYFGLSAFNKDDLIGSIDYGMGLVNDKLQVYIKGTYKGQPTSFASNDLLKIERVGNTIYWKKNGTTFYELNNIAQTELIVDVAMRHQNGKITEAMTSFGIPEPVTRVGEEIVWYNEFGVTIDGSTVSNDVTINAVGGAASKNQLAPNTDGWVEFIVVEDEEGSTDNLSFGLSQFNKDNTAAGINFRFWLYNGLLRGYGKNNVLHSLGDYYVGDILRMERIGEDIYFKKNGHVLYVDEANSTSELIADVSFTNKIEGIISQAKASFGIPEPVIREGEEIVWYNESGVIIDGNTVSNDITINAVGGAASKNQLAPNTDGWVEFTVLEDEDGLTDNFNFGLSQYNKDNAAASIDFRFWLLNGVIRSYGKNNLAQILGNYYVGDVLSIERIGADIYFKKNGHILYVDEANATTELIVDASFSNKIGGIIGQARASFGIPEPVIREGEEVVWYNEYGVTIDGNTISNDMTISSGGAASKNQLAPNTDGWVEFTVLEEGATNNFSFGLAQYNKDNTATSIDFRFWLYNGLLRGYGKDNALKSFGNFYIGDVISMERIGGNIYFKKNGYVLHIDEANSTTELIADVSFSGQLEGAIGHAKASFGIPEKTESNGEKIVWEDLRFIELEENAIVKQHNNQYGCAASNQRLPAGEDGWVDFTILENTSAKYIGLSETNKDHNPQSIGYCLVFNKTGTVLVYEDWINKKNIGNYYPEDIFSIERIADTIHYKKNGVTLYISSKKSTGSLLLDVSLYEGGATITNAKTSFETTNRSVREGHDAHWQKLIGGETDENTYTKTSGQNWAVNGVVSSNLLKTDENGWLETTITQDDKIRMIGLDFPGNDPRWAVAYGVYINGYTLSFYEEGILKATQGYVYKDNILAIERNDTKIEVYKNGELIYTFPTPSTSALVVNGFAVSDQAEIANVRASFPGCTDADGDGICEADDCNDNDPTVPAIPGSYCDDGDENTLEDLVQADSCTCIGTKLTASFFIPDTHEDDPNIRYSNGKVIIGDSTLSKPGNYRLYVEDGMLTEKVVIAIPNTSAWADYVFDADYPLLDLQKVEAFIKKEGHLPEVPSASEIVQNGINVGEIEATLLKKVEELWLHLIELNEKNKALNAKQEQLLYQIQSIENK